MKLFAIFCKILYNRYCKANATKEIEMTKRINFTEDGHKMMIDALNDHATTDRYSMTVAKFTAKMHHQLLMSSLVNWDKQQIAVAYHALKNYKGATTGQEINDHRMLKSGFRGILQLS